MNRVMHFLSRAVAPAEDDSVLLRRFIEDAEESAFAELVRRHGPMVLGVCRRVLGDAHHAEDAFQATFLVLAQRPSAVRNPDAIASWLYGVAFRIARKARSVAQRHPVASAEAEGVSASDPEAEAAWREVRPVIDEELSRLPEKYRIPVVLCYLEGLTNDQAAQQLGWSKGTVSGRLARARDLLRPRLARRGLALTVGVLVALRDGNAVSAAMIESTVQAGLVGGATAQSAALAKGVLTAMGIMRVVKWMAVVVLVGVVGLMSLVCLRAAMVMSAPAAQGVASVGPNRGGIPTSSQPGLLFTLPEEPRLERDDLGQLQGAWRATRLEHAGKALSAEATRKFRLVIRDNTLTFETAGQKREASFTLAAKSKPRAMWLRSADMGTVVQGIYDLQGRTLKLCVDNDTGRTIPTEFATRSGDGLTLMVFEREEAAETPKGQGVGALDPFAEPGVKRENVQRKDDPATKEE